MITLNNLESYCFKDLNYTFYSKYNYAIIGEIGCGKSTLAKIMSNISSSINGSIQSNLKIGYVMQNPQNQFIFEYVYEDLIFGLENILSDKNEIIHKLINVTKFLGISELLERKISTLSGGEQQLIAICSMILMEYEVLILDEVTSMLDPISKDSLINNLISYAKSNNIMFIFITHDNNIMTKCDKIIKLENNKLIEIKKKELDVTLNYINKSLQINCDTLKEFEQWMLQ